MSFVRSIRPSNMVIVASLPFILYLFASSPDYQRALLAIIGVEQGSSAFVPGFLLWLAVSAAGLAAPLMAGLKAPRKRLAVLLALVGVAALILLLVRDTAHPFIASVLANGVDPFTSPLVEKGVTPRQLTPQADLLVGQAEIWMVRAYGLLVLLGAGLMLAGGALARPGRVLLYFVNGGVLVFLLLFAPLAFASGLATTIRAAILAYILAAILGLIWVALHKLRASRVSLIGGCALALLLALVSGWFLLQPRAPYALVGTLDGKIGIIANTPAGLISDVRFGHYDGAPAAETPVRTFATAAKALQSIAAKEGVSGALLPLAEVPADWPVLWKTEALNDRDRAAGISFAVLSIVAGLLTLGGFLHKRHPLSIGAEFIVDTIRGIPMLVIVLYVGLPLSGALKDATAGVFDPPNLVRGIVAMAIAYSAYLAEIFRSGINAVPVGQIEAAASIGLNRWQTARLIILPQAFRIVIPPLGNELIAILKDTSLLSILSIRDVTQRMREFQSASFLAFAPYNAAAILYVFLTLAAATAVSMVEKKYDKRHR